MTKTDRPRFYGARLLLVMLTLYPLIGLFEILDRLLIWLIDALRVMQRDLILWAMWLLGLDVTPCGECDACRAEQARKAQRERRG